MEDCDSLLLSARYVAKNVTQVRPQQGAQSHGGQHLESTGWALRPLDVHTEPSKQARSEARRSTRNT